MSFRLIPRALRRNLKRESKCPLVGNTPEDSCQGNYMNDARIAKPLTTGCQEAAQRYQLAVDGILGSEAGVAETLDQALALDSDFALALAARYMVSKDARSADADLFKERALRAAGD